MGYDIGILLDGLILVFLSVTIFYAARLSLFLKAFREGRNGMEILIRDLNITIQKAEGSIAHMREEAQVSEAEIREVINEAKFLADELRFMNEAGDGLAGRLEKLADRNRELVDLMENAGGIGTQKITPYDPRAQYNKPAASAASAAAAKEKPQSDPFEIMDFDLDEGMDEDDERDFLALEDGAYQYDSVKSEQEPSHKSAVDTQSKSKLRSFAIFDKDFVSQDQEDSAAESAREESQFSSRAEQELYEALQRRRRGASDNEAGSLKAVKRVSEIT